MCICETGYNEYYFCSRDIFVPPDTHTLFFIAIALSLTIAFNTFTAMPIQTLSPFPGNASGRFTTAG